MLIFIDEYGKHHSAMAEIKETKGINGEKSISGTIFTNDEILEGIGRGWKARFNNENYYLTYAYPIDEGNRIEIEFDAIHEFFFNMKKSVIHDQLDGSHTMVEYLDFIFEGSEYTYSLEITISAFEKQSFGYKDRLTLFNDIVSSTKVEFSVTGNHVRILNEVGTDLSSIVKKGFNMNELKIENDIGSFITAKKGYGAYLDENDHSKGRLVVEYISPLVEIYGLLEGTPVVDERYTVENNLLERLKNEVESSYGISVTVDMEDLTQAGYEYDKPHEGDYIMAINEDLKFHRKVRITSYTTEYDTSGRILNHEVECGSKDIISKMNQSESSYKKEVQSSLDVVRSQSEKAWLAADQKSTIYWGEEAPTKGLRVGDTWYQIIGEQTVMKYWNGYEWQLFLDPKAQDLKIKDAFDTAEEAKVDAEKAYNDAVKNANSLVTEAESNWDHKLTETKNNIAGDIAKVNEVADNAQNTAELAHEKAINVAEQAEEIVGEVFDVKNDVSDNKIKANEAHQEALLAAEKAEEIAVQVGTIEQDVEGNKSTIAQLDNQITTIVEDVEGNKTSITQLDSQITNVAKDVSDNKSSIIQMADQISSVVEDVSGNTTAITQLDNEISLVVEDVEGNKSSITQTNNRIDSVITDVEGNATAIVQTNNQISSIAKDVSDNTSSIIQQGDKITAVVKDTNDNKSSIVQLSDQVSTVVEDVSGNKTSISQLKDNISLKVDVNSIVSSINLSTEGVRIKGNKIVLDGDVIMSSAWINNLYANNAFLDNLSARSIEAVSADITNIITKNLAADTITSKHLKVDSALFSKIFADSAFFTRLVANDTFTDNLSAKAGFISKLTANSAFISKINAMDIDAARITTGTLSAIKISGKNLAIDLSTGEVKFSRGVIQSNYIEFNVNESFIRLKMKDRPKTYVNLDAEGIQFSDERFDAIDKVGSGFDMQVSQYSSTGIPVMDVNWVTFGSVDISSYDPREDGSNFSKMYLFDNGVKLSAIGRTIYHDANRHIAKYTEDMTVTSGSINMSVDPSAGKMEILGNQLHVFTTSFRVSGLPSGTGSNINLQSNGYLVKVTSARKYKKDIKIADKLIDKAEAILNINPVSWIDKREALEFDNPKRQHGFIADEFHEAGLSEVVIYDDKDEIESLMYERIPIYHHVLIQKLWKKVQELEKRLEVN